MSVGVIRTTKDIVVGVQFDESPPQVGEVLVVDNEQKTILLVDHLQTGNVAICLNVQADRTLHKNMKVQATGKGIEIPVGDMIIGRMFNALGQIIDDQPALAGNTEVRNILRTSSRHIAATPKKPEVFETDRKSVV